MSEDDLVKFAAILDEFAAAQRAQGLAQTKRQRVTVTRPVGDLHVQFETLVDEGASPSEIYEALAPFDSAIDRLKAKVDLASHYERMANLCGQIEMSVNKLLADRAQYQVDNEKRNQNRRVAIVLTDQQSAGLNQHRDAINDGFARIEELRAAAEECARIIGGESPFAVLDRQITQRLDRLRGQRPDAA